MVELIPLYVRVGGDPGVRALVDAFYDAMDTRPDAAAIRALHPADLSGSREKLFEFLCGWLGGPEYYVAKRGHPRLRARHLPFPIDESGAVAWLVCMDDALEATVSDTEAKATIRSALTRLAHHMRNVE